jgi:hypothetical protein
MVSQTLVILGMETSIHLLFFTNKNVRHHPVSIIYINHIILRTSPFFVIYPRCYGVFIHSIFKGIYLCATGVVFLNWNAFILTRRRRKTLPPNTLSCGFRKITLNRTPFDLNPMCCQGRLSLGCIYFYLSFFHIFSLLESTFIRQEMPLYNHI